MIEFSEEEQKRYNEVSERCRGGGRMMEEGGVGRKGEWGTRERQLEGVEDSCLLPPLPEGVWASPC